MSSSLTPQVADEFSVLEPTDFSLEMPEFLPDICPVKAALGSELPGRVVELVSNASSLSLMRATIETNEDYKPPRHDMVHQEGQMPAAHYREGSYHKGKDLGKGCEFPRDVGKGISHQNKQRDQAKFPQPNGRHTTNKHDPSEYLRTYNCLLRDGRLADCIELLESMEQRGLLDMDKIYHVKFFNTCKSQKAVKEAFSFINLIGNPTLSTLNMLLSVSASSQDSEGAFKILQLVREAGLKTDCKLYTILISTCAKSGKVDSMFEVKGTNFRRLWKFLVK